MLITSLCFPSANAIIGDQSNYGNISNSIIESVISDYMDARNLLFTTGSSSSLSTVAIDGIVNDELNHYQLITDRYFPIYRSTYEIINISQTDTFVTLYLQETVQTGNTINCTEIIDHSIAICYDESNQLVVVSDAYCEKSTGFFSASYVDDNYNQISPDAAGSALCITQVAASQIGYIEKASNSNLNSFTANPGSANYTKYGAWYGLNGYEWCAIFVAWCANQANVAQSIVPKVADAGSVRNHFQNLNRFHFAPNYSSSSYTPKAGDIIVFGTSATYATHVGIVLSATSSTVNIVEGNSSNRVASNSYSRTNTSIVGYGNPAYGYGMHSHNSTWRSDLYNHWRVCMNCSYTFNRASHTWVQKPSYYQCSVCGYTTTTAPEIMSVGALHLE